MQALDYDAKKKQANILKKEIDSLRSPLEEAVDTAGSVTPTGSKVFVIPYADKEIQLHKTLRLSSVLVPEAEDILRKNHLTECLETVTLVREDIIERLYQSGKLSVDILNKLYVQKENYAFSVKVKPRFHEAE